MRKLRLLLIIIFCSNISKAQNDPKIFPPSPEIASLGKFIDQPMSLSTGTPNISIPIYNLIVSSALSYPINLNYQASGIRVNEISSKVGLGWSIGGVGMITRTVKGFPDDLPSKGYLYCVKKLSDIAPILTDHSNINYKTLPDLLDANDMESDEYVFMVSGNSFKFYYDKTNGRFLQAPLSDNKVEPQYDSNGYITTWKVTDAAGLKYYFGTNNNIEKYENT